MAFITPNENCGCCPACAAFDCKEGTLDSSRIVDGIVITIANSPSVATSLHHAFRFNGFSFEYEWFEITDLSSLIGNYTLPRVDESQCSAATSSYSNFSISGNLYKATAVDGDGCPSGIITTAPFTHAVNGLTVSWDNLLGFSLIFSTTTAQFGTGGGFFASPHAYSFSASVARSAVQCAGGGMSVSIPGRVVGDVGFCAGYPSNLGLNLTYSFTP